MKIIQKDTDNFQCFIGLNGMTHSQPCNGGLRVKTYLSEKQAWEDCRNLSLVMTHKHSIYNTGFSGGKIVVAIKEEGVYKQDILSCVGAMLNELNGLMYTGCDLNTTLEDMEYLRNHCPYILASLDSQVDPSIATAHGVVGSIKGIFGDNLQGLVFLVHGLGKVGKATALGLQALGASIITYDIESERADIPDCQNISEQKNWWDVPCDVLVPCSISGLITPEIADNLQCKYIVGSANVPLSNPHVLDALQTKSITFIPESISSAGAIICDSIEFYAPSIFQQLDPKYIYAFVEELVAEKTQQFLLEINNSKLSYQQVIAILISGAEQQLKAGHKMQGFLADSGIKTA